MNRTQRLRNRMILPAALLTAVVLLLCIPALPAAQAATLSYTAPGDSISTGYGLANAEQEGFAALLAEEKGYILSNHAANGNTATGLRAQLYNEEGNVALSVKSADVITLTVGGNDLMAVLYQVVADEYNLRNPNSEPITAKDVPDLLQKGDFSTKLAVIGVVMELLTEGSPTYILENDAFIEAVAGYGDTLEEVTAQIRTMNEDVVLVIATQYNPYKEFKDVKIRITDLSPVYYGVEAGILLLNDEIVRVAEK